MKIGDLKSLQAQITRQFGVMAERSGKGESWDYVDEHGQRTTYAFHGIKKFEDWISDLQMVMVLLWNAKDWIKQNVASPIKPQVEALATSDGNLRLCGALANLIKHGAVPREEPQWTHPRFGKLKISAPGASVSQLFMDATRYGVAVGRPELVEYELPIVDGNGRVLGEAGEVAQKSWIAWVGFMAQQGLLRP